MDMTRKEKPEGTSLSSDRLIIFLFFLVGALGSYYLPVRLPPALSPRLLYGGLLGTVLLLSFSFYGCVLLPVSALVWGAVSEQGATAAVMAWHVSRVGDLRELLCSLILVPAFFVAATHGVSASASLQDAVLRGSPTARANYYRELPLILFVLLLGCAAVFYYY